MLLQDEVALFEGFKNTFQIGLVVTPGFGAPLGVQDRSDFLQQEVRIKALVLMRKLANQGVSFKDSLSAVLMKRAGSKRIFGSARHFEAMGSRDRASQMA